MKLRVGIAGYGIVGRRRHTFIDLHSNLRVVAICDRVFSEEGIFENGVHYHQNYQQLLKEDLDVLFVCMTNDIAAEVTVAGLNRGLHVFCEKPPGRDLKDIERVINCKKEHPNLKLKYGFNHRYHDSVIDALSIIRNKSLGAVMNLRGVYGKSKILTYSQHSDWRSKREIAGGGILLDQGIHMVDLLRLFAEEEFKDVYSFVSNDYWRHNVEDNAYALMRTKQNKVAMLHSSATQWRHRFDLDIHLERGAIHLSGILSGSKSYGSETMTIAWATEDDRGDPKEQTTRYNEDNSWKREVFEFADAILNDKDVIHGTLIDAYKTMHLVYRIYHADREWSARWKMEEIPQDHMLV